MLHEKIMKLYFTRLNFLIFKGTEEGKIVPFDDEFYNQMKSIYVQGLPVSIHIKYLKSEDLFGRCLDRSLYMFLCFKDALMVSGNVKNLELLYGKEYSEHRWIEIGNYVYDPTSLMRYEKDLYYNIFKPSKISKCTHEQYKKENPKFYNEIMNITIKDFQVGGKKRFDLLGIIPIIKAMNYMQNESFFKDLNEYLKIVEYDEKIVFEELNSIFAGFVKSMRIVAE